jgi:hypothetical protein
MRAASNGISNPVPARQSRENASGSRWPGSVGSAHLTERKDKSDTNVGIFALGAAILTGGQKMNIKSLLLGSAAALIAVSGARAADAVVAAEPEPAEYVKICDVYGAGYFYIPGTETCLKIGGYVRYDAGVGNKYSIDGTQTLDRLNDKQQGTWYKNARADLQVTAASETEYGTLKSVIELRAEFGNSAGNYPDGSVDDSYAGKKTVYANQAYIQLGGLTVGHTDSLYASMTNFGGSAIQDSIIAYGDQNTINLVSYVFDAGNGFSAGVSLEQANGEYEYKPAKAFDGDNTMDSYVPHIVLGAKYTQGWGGVSGVVAYNSNFEEWAGKLRLDVKATDQLSLWVMGGYGTEKNSYTNFYKPWLGKWAIFGGADYKLNEKANLFVEAAYDDGKQAWVGAGVAYQVVPGFTITPEIDYNRGAKIDNNTGVITKVKSGFGGIIRFQRDF